MSEYRVAYTLTPDALADASRLHQASFFARYRIAMGVIAGIGVIAAMAGYRSLGIGMVVFGLILLGLTWTRFIDRILLSRQGRSVFGGSAAFVADDQGLHYEHPLGSGVIPWSGLTHVRSDDRAIVFARDRVLAAYIPATAFATPKERDSFVRFARGRVAGSSDIRAP